LRAQRSNPAFRAVDDGEKARTSFLRKTSKKLLLLWIMVVSPPKAPINKSFFASFFAKKEVLTYFS
jgi:hypothetical protein